jgi:hypothetical protein
VCVRPPDAPAYVHPQLPHKFRTASAVKCPVCVSMTGPQTGHRLLRRGFTPTASGLATQRKTFVIPPLRSNKMLGNLRQGNKAIAAVV